MSNLEVFARTDSALLVERQQEAQHQVISVLVEALDRSLTVHHRRSVADFEMGVEQAAAGVVFVFEAECALAARWERGYGE